MQPRPVKAIKDTVSSTSVDALSSHGTDMTRYHKGWVAVFNEYTGCSSLTDGSCYNNFMVEMVSIGKCMPGSYLSELANDDNSAGSWKILWAESVPDSVDNNGGHMDMSFQYYHDDFCQKPSGRPELDSLGNYLTCDVSDDNWNSFKVLDGGCGADDYTYYTYPAVVDYPWNFNNLDDFWDEPQLYMIHHNPHLIDPYRGYIDETCANFDSDETLSALLLLMSENDIPKYTDDCYDISAMIFMQGRYDTCENSGYTGSLGTDCITNEGTGQFAGSVTYDMLSSRYEGYSNCINIGDYGDSAAFMSSLLCHSSDFF